MSLFSRKFLHLHHSHHNVTDIVITQSSSSSSSASLGEQSVRDIHEGDNSYSPTCCFNSFRLNPPFDSAMALTVLVLLTALFFMGFFSIYIRRFSDENSVDQARRRRAAGTRFPPGKKGGKGVDPAIVESLPAYLYAGRDVEGEEEESQCAICLGEFEEKEWVKSIPYCGHVFHVTCIDMWLSSHVTCPLCRTAEFFPAVSENKEEVIDNAIMMSRRVASEMRDTCRVREEEVGPTWDGERVTLHRSSSF
ncbi:hypothetical protein RND81_11G109900 [Saponaria officinalis]|uniref:RING-type E3 ubiquitin transferase n=1 Tax=Saponaria officinalis TaxID=3572 RepID=A0AAW1HJM8_SAPOF